MLNRRPRSRIGWASLMPRCRRLTYAEVTHIPLLTYFKDGREHSGRAISIYDLDVLFEAFRSVQVDLGRLWRPAAYAAARDSAVLHWLVVQLRNPAIDLDTSVRRIEERLREAGLRHMLPVLRRRARAASVQNQAPQG